MPIISFMKIKNELDIIESRAILILAFMKARDFYKDDKFSRKTEKKLMIN
jgi:hypothetical protein